jgi:hypothetical protein
MRASTSKFGRNRHVSEVDVLVEHDAELVTILNEEALPGRPHHRPPEMSASSRDRSCSSASAASRTRSPASRPPDRWVTGVHTEMIPYYVMHLHEAAR